LVVDDAPQIQRLLRIAFGNERFKWIEARTAAAALELFAVEEFDLVILDLGLPDQNGFTVLEAIHQNSSAPIIVLSVRDDEASKVKALDLGAYDYVTKPFGIPELGARIRAALRHHYQEKGTNPVVRCGDVLIDLVNRRVSRGGEDVQLSPTEYQILHLLAEDAGKILTHNSILEKIHGDKDLRDVHYLRVYVRSLRQKLGDEAGHSAIIRTEMGIGYRLMVSEPNA